MVQSEGSSSANCMVSGSACLSCIDRYLMIKQVARSGKHPNQKDSIRRQNMLVIAVALLNTMAAVFRSIAETNMAKIMCAELLINDSGRQSKSETRFDLTPNLSAFISRIG